LVENPVLNEDSKLVLIVKDIQNDDPYVGSVSIPR
jgi:hypothetical protein